MKTGENLISVIKEAFVGEKLLCYILENPCLIQIDNQNEELENNLVNVSLYPWPILSEQTTIEVFPGTIITVVEPKEQLKKMYESQVLGVESNENN